MLPATMTGDFNQALWPYLVIYDLQNAAVNVTSVEAILQDLGAKHVLAQTWLISSDTISARTLRETIRLALRPFDRLLIVELGEDVATHNLEEIRV